MKRGFQFLLDFVVRFYWDVCHMLDAEIRNLIVTGKDTSGHIIVPTNIKYIGNNQIEVWFDTYTKGFIYIQKR